MLETRKFRPNAHYRRRVLGRKTLKKRMFRRSR